MKLQSKIALGLATLALGVAPAAAGATSGPNYAPEHEHPSHPPKGHGYGYYCKGESKMHVKGQQGTPFSTCVKGVAQMRKDKAQEETQS
jgi:hypothetical protein